jgi:hypothetical protein
MVEESDYLMFIVFEVNLIKSKDSDKTNNGVIYFE